MEQTTGGYEKIPGYLCLHYSSITVLSITVCICVLSLSFSQETRCMFKLFDEQKHDSDRVVSF